MKKISLLIGMMLMLTVFGSFFFVENASAVTKNVGPGQTYATIQAAINAATAGDTIDVYDGYYVGNVKVNKSLTIESVNGSDLCWINGTVNITRNDVAIGGPSAGFTIYQATTTNSKVNAINISTNGSRDNIDIYFNEILGGYNGIQIGGGSSTTANTASDITIYSNIIRNTGASGIRVQTVWFNDSYIYANQILNTSNAVTAAGIKLDGAHSVDLITNVIHDTMTQGGEGINITGVTHPCEDVLLQWNVIYDTDGYSPIIVRSLSAAVYAKDMRIISNDLSNYDNTIAEAGLRFDNISGLINAANISVFYNKFNTSIRDIEERFALTADYDNWTGVMPAYFNFYGHTLAGTAGTFRYAGHQIAAPYLLSSNAYDDIIPFGTLEITGAVTDYLNNTYDADTNVSGTSTDDVIIVVYPYPITLLSTYPTRSMHKYVEIGLSDASHIAEPANITIYYTTADLATRGWAEDHIHGLVYYNSTSGEWERFNNTGCRTNDTMGYEGFAWANVYSSLSGIIVGIDYNVITAPPGGGGTTPPPAPPGGTTTVPAVPDIIMDNIVYIVILIIVIVILLFLVIVFMNPKLRRKWFG